MELADKTALITSGTAGIGLACARLFAREGATVAITGRDASWRGVVRHTSSPPRAACPSPPAPQDAAKTQVHAAFDVQDTEAWSNADDLRTPSEVKAELARLRQLALACVTAKMDNKKVNDKIDLNARARRPMPSMRLVAISLPWEWFLFC